VIGGRNYRQHQEGLKLAIPAERPSCTSSGGLRARSRASAREIVDKAGEFRVAQTADCFGHSPSTGRASRRKRPGAAAGLAAARRSDRRDLKDR
jgi:hypothetical protein